MLIHITILVLALFADAPQVIPLPPRPARAMVVPAPTMPPSPLNPKNWANPTSLAALTQRATTQEITPEKTPLVLVGDYSGPVEARYELRVYETTDLRNWTNSATLPVSSSWAYMVPRKVSAFYHVKAWDTLEDKELLGSITKMVMDP